MLPYTVIKEANPPQLGGTATGVINFLNFTFSALLGPVFGWALMAVAGGGGRTLDTYQTAFEPLLYGVALAVGFLTLTSFRAVFDVARALPNWVTIGLLGLILLGLGVLVLVRRDRLEAWGSKTLQRWSELT